MRAVEKLKRPILLKPKKTTKATPCAPEITNLFNCWRNHGNMDEKSCLQSVLLLKNCMKTKASGANKNTVRN